MRVKAKKLYAAIALALAAMLVASTAAIAAVTLNPDGTGFVGKGDVQTALGYNNAQLQANADSLQFSVEQVSEVTWECTNSRNENVQERQRETTSQSLLSSVARVKNQITGFNLTGYNGSPTVISTEGPQPNSCPAAASGWSLTTPAGDPVIISSTLKVNGVALQ